jgi:hypothetical protein
MSVAGLESTYSSDLAAFLSAASKADAHWYSVKCLSEGIPSLPDLFGISEKKLNEFLVVLSGFFGKLGRGDCFHFWQDKFNKVFVMSEIGSYCEHTQFRVKDFTRTQHFIRVLALQICQACPSLEPLLGVEDQG